ncbi:MutS protein msh5, partial [Ascosphaera aggregata]
MAVDVQSKDTVGCCYYKSDEQTLYLFEDITSGGDDMIERLRLDIMPTHLLASTRTDQSASRLSEKARATFDMATDRQFNLPYVLEPRPCQDFNAGYAISQLAALQSSLAAETTRILVPSDACTAVNVTESDEIGLTDQRSKLIALSGLLNTDNHVSIGCAGALLTYLQKKRFASRITVNGNEAD